MDDDAELPAVDCADEVVPNGWCGVRRRITVGSEGWGGDDYDSFFQKKAVVVSLMMV
jgi:hypothetical protein